MFFLLEYTNSRTHITDSVRHRSPPWHPSTPILAPTRRPLAHHRHNLYRFSLLVSFARVHAALSRVRAPPAPQRPAMPLAAGWAGDLNMPALGHSLHALKRPRGCPMPRTSHPVISPPPWGPGSGSCAAAGGGGGAEVMDSDLASASERENFDQLHSLSDLAQHALSSHLAPHVCIRALAFPPPPSHRAHHVPHVSVPRSTTRRSHGTILHSRRSLAARPAEAKAPASIAHSNSLKKGA